MTLWSQSLQWNEAYNRNIKQVTQLELLLTSPVQKEPAIL